MTAAAIANSEAIAIKVPPLARDVDDEPFPEITRAETKDPEGEALRPGLQICGQQLMRNM